MFANKKYTGLLLVFVALWAINYKSFGQGTDSKVNYDSSQRITLREFNSRIDRATLLLQTKKLAEISDADHINIMMCWNTIFMTAVDNRYIKIRKVGNEYVKFWGFRKPFVGSRYSKLEKALDYKKYIEDITKVYPVFTFNRGMGYFFPILNMEFGGTPHAYAMFEISN